MHDLGRRVYGLAAIALGLIGLRWDQFAAVWQPVDKTVPNYGVLAYLAAAMFLVAGLAAQSRRTARVAGVVLAALYVIFVLGWVRRIVALPHVFGVWSGAAEQLALVMGGAAVFAMAARAKIGQRSARIARVVFGVCAVAFGISHFLYVKETAGMTPAWLPPGPVVWAYITGACHIAAGLALVSGIQAVLAGRLLTAMFVAFGALVWAPQLYTHPDHDTWCGNAINLALTGAIWAVADAAAWFGGARNPRPSTSSG